MIRWFRRQRPAAPVDDRLPLSEALIASYWDINEHDWKYRLTEKARAYARENVTNAPRFTN